MNKNGKPVRKCNGCELNLGNHCAICQNPHERWKSKTCSGYNNEKLIHAYTRMLLRPINERKENRKLQAKQRRSNEHYQNVTVKFKRNGIYAY